MGIDNGDWQEYSKLVLFQLEQHSKDLKDIRNEVGGIRQDLVILKVKSSIFGAIAGFIVATAVSVVLKLIG